MSKNLVVKDNVLINASYNLDLIEQRLILLAIVGARKTCQEIKPNAFLTICVQDYVNEFGLEYKKSVYERIKGACKTLFERQFTYKQLTSKGNIKKITSRWVQSIAYVDKEALVQLKFSDDVIPLITMLEKHFTSYELEQVAELNSKYAVRLYEIVIAWRSQCKTPMITVVDLRERLGVLDDEYNLMADFKKRVLDYSIKEINEKTNITLSYEQYKQGRKIVGFVFTIEQKVIENKKSNAIDLDNLTDQEREIIAQKKTYASQKGITDPLHIQNLINQGLEQHRQAVQDEQERLKQQKEKRQAKKQKVQEQIAFAKQQYERILASDELIQAYIAHNINSKHLQGIRKFYYEQGDYHNLFKLEQDKFIEPHRFVYVNLDFMV